MSKLLQNIAQQQANYARTVSRAYQKQHGQIFTPPEVAEYMASLCNEFPKQIRILDPGAGFGILTAAICEQIIKGKVLHSIEATLFETDSKLLDALEQNLCLYKELLEKQGHALSYSIRNEDFIETAAATFSEPSLFTEGFHGEFTTILMNPPYFKVRKDSRHAKLMDSIVHGQPNAYAFFFALGAKLLTKNGELVTITPRSFCNGLYFRAFRKWLFDRLSIKHIHLFESRSNVFSDAGVLQESVITKFKRDSFLDKHVAISSSFGKDIGSCPQREEFHFDEIIEKTDGQWAIRIPTSCQDRHVLQALDKLPTKFSQTGLCISTGPVVAFRAKDYLAYTSKKKEAMPLFWPHNIKRFSISWPELRKNKEDGILLTNESRKLLVPAKNYVVLKRFSSKEEKRRLTAGCLLQEAINEPWLGLENHLNYIYHESRDLSVEEVFGIAAFFNSTLVDQYFRILSGNTQVNATEIRGLPFPALSLLFEIGVKVRGLSHLDMQDKDVIDNLIAEAIGLKGDLTLEHKEVA